MEADPPVCPTLVQPAIESVQGERLAVTVWLGLYHIHIVQAICKIIDKLHENTACRNPL